MPREPARSFAVLLAGAALLAAPGPVAADPVADFYKANPITILVSSATGGGYDAYARFLARHMPRHIPGAPAMVVKNMPGAGGATAGNYLTTSAPRDGSVIATLQNTLTIDQLTRSPSLKFDMRRLDWLGSMNVVQQICVFDPRVPVASAADLLSREITIGGSGGATSSSVLIPTLLNRLVGTHLNIVKGYDGTNVVFLAMARGEVDGICGVGWDSVQVQALPLLARGEIRLGLDVGTSRNEDLAARGVPFVMEMLPDGDNKEVLRLLLSPGDYGRPFAAPPGTPPDRLAALRRAFADTMGDPEFLADAKRANLEIDPATPEQILAALDRTFDAPPRISARAVQELQAAGWNAAN